MNTGLLSVEHAATTAVMVATVKQKTDHTAQTVLGLMNMPQVSPEKKILMGLFSYYLKQLPTLWNLDCHTEDGVKHEFSDKHLGWMCLTAVENTPEWPDDKLNRWLGYIQGVMAMKGYIDVQEEHDRTREVFNRTYEHRGIPIPETLEDNVSDV